MLVFLIWCCCGKKLRKSCWTITKYFTLQCFHQHKIINHCLVCAQHQVLMWFLSVVQWRTNREFRNILLLWLWCCDLLFYNSMIEKCTEKWYLFLTPALKCCSICRPPAGWCCMLHCSYTKMWRTRLYHHSG